MENEQIEDINAQYSTYNSNLGGVYYSDWHFPVFSGKHMAVLCIKTVMTNLSSILGFITIVPYNDLLIF